MAAAMKIAVCFGLALLVGWGIARGVEWLYRAIRHEMAHAARDRRQSPSGIR